MNVNPKVLFVANKFGGGGAERVTSILCNHFYAKGYRSGAVSIDEDHCSYELSQGVKMYGCQPCRQKHINIIKRLHLIKRVLSEFDPDIVVALGRPMKYVLAVTRGMQVQTVASERNYPPCIYSEREFCDCVKNYERASRVVFQTEEVQQLFPTDIVSKSKVIPNPLVTALPEYGGPCSKRIVTAARLEPQKNLRLLIDAFNLFREKVPGYCLDIFGDGSLRFELQQHINSLQLEDRVKLRPYSDDVHSEIRDAAIFVSSSDFEGMQNSLMEAMAMGIPCVATDGLGGGARLLTEGGRRGLLVERGNRKALAEAMIAVAVDRKLAEVLSCEGKSIACEKHQLEILNAWEQFLVYGY